MPSPPPLTLIPGDGSGSDISPPRLRKEVSCPDAPRKKKLQKSRPTSRLSLTPPESTGGIHVVVRSLEEELNAAASIAGIVQEETETLQATLVLRHIPAQTAPPSTVPRPSSPSVSPRTTIATDG
jgi:hypothetical protein